MSRAALVLLAPILASFSAETAAARATAEVQGSFWQAHWLQIGFGLALLLMFLGAMWFLRTRWRERAIATAKLEASQAQLRMVLASAGCELWRYNVHEQIVYRENVLRHISAARINLSADELIQAIHPEDRALFNAAMLAHLRGLSECFEVLYRMTSVQGNEVWLRSNGKIELRDAAGKVLIVSGTTIEVTQLKQKEQQIEAANEVLSSQIDELKAARASIIEVEKRRKLALWGSGCEFFEANLVTQIITRENKTPGLAVNDLGHGLGQYWAHLHPDDAEIFRAAFLAHVTGKAEFYDVIYRARRAEGGWCWLQTRGRAVEWDENGRATVISGTNYDISELKTAEIALKKSAEELEARVQRRTADLTFALDELRSAQRQLVDSEKMAALGNLVAGVAHEINTPLGISVTAASHLGEISQRLTRQLESGQLKKSELSEFAEASQSAVELVMSNLRRASELVKSFKQVAVDQSSEQRRMIELKPYFQDILNSLRPSTKRFRHVIELDIQENVHWDSFPGALYQITSNLVLNALNHAFGEQDRGLILIQASADAETITLSVTDNGSGMDAETANHIFEPFFTTKRGQGGSGLGLHIVFNLVTSVLGGSISVQTAPGAGAKFLIRVPR
jgi:signal transduction histidine kinase